MQRNGEILVPAGKFLMGRDDGPPEEGPAHTVEMPAFYMDANPVSNADFLVFCADTGQPAPDSHFHPHLNASDQPVTMVSWYQAAAFAQWAEKELPTEAQWEYAARFGHTGKQPLGAGDVGLAVNRVLPLASLSPTPLGIHGLGCNVWEWTRDWFQPDFYRQSPRRAPAGPESGTAKVIRGNDWEDFAGYRRLTNRGQLIPPDKRLLVGFRCVRPA